MTTESSTVYTPIGFMSFEEWAGSIEERTERIQKLVIPTIDTNRVTDLNAKSFLRVAIQELTYISQTKFTDIGNPPSEYPVFCLLNEDTGGKNPDYNLNGLRGTHSESTVAAAQILIDVLCPEFGISLKDSLETLAQKAERARLFGYGDHRLDDERNPHDSVTFSTVLPGITLGISFYRQQRYVSIAENVM